MRGAGIVSAGLNLVNFALTRHSYSWLLATHIAGCLIIISVLCGDDMRNWFRRGSSRVWTSKEPMIQSLRMTILSHFAAIPMLLVYAWMQPVVEATAPYAVALAALLSVSVILASLRKVVGAVGLTIGGVSLLGFGLTTLLLRTGVSQSAWAGQVAAYYAVFWFPAGICALVCARHLAKPVTRLMLGTGSNSD